MDRDNRWERVEKAYDAIARGKGVTTGSASECIEASYAGSVTDEFVVPTVITCDGKPAAVIKENDSVIFFNFRPDRAREISRVFCDPNFNMFQRDFFPLTYVCLTEYDHTIPKTLVAFEPESLHDTLGEYLSRSGFTLSGALSRRLERDLAGRFSFLLAIPAILGALLLQLRELYKTYHFQSVNPDAAAGFLTGIAPAALIAGTLTAALVGLGAVTLMLKIIRKHSLFGFGIYTTLLGLLILLDQAALHVVF
jgi:hypothetical protein